jgi:hypothetical protein
MTIYIGGRLAAVGRTVRRFNGPVVGFRALNGFGNGRVVRMNGFRNGAY